MTLLSCDLQVPRDAQNTGIPLSWIHDSEAPLEVRGLVFCLLTYLTPGLAMTVEQLEELQPRAGEQISDLIGDAVACGYLERLDDVDDQPHYRLVHPARLGPFKGAA